MLIFASQIIAFLIINIVIISLLFFIGFVTRYKKCPSDKILVIYGKVSSSQKDIKRYARCIHGGAVMVWPFIQAYKFLDLTPMSIDVDLKAAISKKHRVDVVSRFTVGISTEDGVMQNAAERLLGLKLNAIQDLAKDIIIGQLRLLIAAINIDEINEDHDKFLEMICKNVETEINKIGLRLINANIIDIKTA